ncbi:threonine/serine exporter family protein [Clostridium sardiniense]|uniref:threonine/serine exporter family protein n=1 Tax=Clostridium sardiniense TaxID=29369 RepID=UPI003D32A031
MTIILQTIYAFIATLGFGIIFNIHGRNLFFAAIGGGISWFVYALGLEAHFSTTTNFFLSAVVFSIYSEILARKLKTPVTTLVACALIPLVPGSGMYYTMYQAVTGDVMQSLELGLNTLASAGALALGVIFVSTITRQYYKVKLKSKVQLKRFQKLKKIEK